MTDYSKDFGAWSKDFQFQTFGFREHEENTSKLEKMLNNIKRHEELLKQSVLKDDCFKQISIYNKIKELEKELFEMTIR